MLSAIISDTLLLKSPTTTDDDKAAVEKLAKIADIDAEEYFRIKEEETYALSDLLYQNQYLAYIAPNEVKRIVLTIYLEGWDKECSNDLINSAFNASISFMGEHRSVPLTD